MIMLYYINNKNVVKNNHVYLYFLEEVTKNITVVTYFIIQNAGARFTTMEGRLVLIF
jgi:hypothetical protein